MSMFDTIHLRRLGKTEAVQTHELDESMATWNIGEVCPAVSNDEFLLVEDIYGNDGKTTFACMFFKNKMLIDWCFAPTRNQARRDGRRIQNRHKGRNSERILRIISDWNARKDKNRQSLSWMLKNAIYDWNRRNEEDRFSISLFINKDRQKFLKEHSLDEVMTHMIDEHGRETDAIFPMYVDDVVPKASFIDDLCDVDTTRIRTSISLHDDEATFDIADAVEWKRRFAKALETLDLPTVGRLFPAIRDDDWAQDLMTEAIGKSLFSWGGSFDAAEIVMIGGTPPDRIMETPFSSTPLFIKVLRDTGAERHVYQRILSARKELRDEIDEAGNNALLLMAARGDTDAVTFLVTECGAKVDVCDTGGDTPLHFAADSGNVALISFLLDEGHAPDITNKNGDTPAARLMKKLDKDRNKEPMDFCDVMLRLLRDGEGIGAARSFATSHTAPLLARIEKEMLSEGRGGTFSENRSPL